MLEWECGEGLSPDRAGLSAPSSPFSSSLPLASRHDTSNWPMAMARWH